MNGPLIFTHIALNCAMSVKITNHYKMAMKCQKVGSQLRRSIEESVEGLTTNSNHLIVESYLGKIELLFLTEERCIIE